jgi:hypothetical protein
VTENLTIRVPLSYAFFLQQEQAIDNLLSFSPWVSPALEADVFEVGAFYWTALAPEIVNSRREEQGSVSV